METTRLRSAFKYQADTSNDDDLPEDMDEEEQEKLIKKLREEDDERNEEYKRAFLAIPAISATTYIPALIMSRLLSAKLISILSMTSLVASAYILVFVPNSKSDKPRVKDSRRGPQLEEGPVKRYVAYLNGGLSLLIALNSIGFKGKKGVHEGFWLLCLLPLGRFSTPFRHRSGADNAAVSFLIIMLARRLMLSVDVDELEKLKYGYKGA